MTGVSERWRLGHRPALDGIRAIAITLVVLRHVHVPGFSAAGTVGVTMFFTLSGFLITSLLLEELADQGRIRFGAFFLRRALRLFPALIACVTLVALLSWATGARMVTPGDVVAAYLYATNWINLDAPGDGLLAHTWSLAVEEQFYLTWPLVLALLWRRGRGVVLAFAVTAAVASLVLRVVLWDGGAGMWRIAFGFDTKADALLIGCALAVFMHGRADRASRSLAAAAAVSGLLVLSFTTGAAAFVVGPTLIALTTGWLIHCTATGAGVRWLQWPALVLVGRRSYGLYLWHYPVATIILRLEVGDWPLRLALTLVVSWGLTLLSWRYVETPFLQMKARLTTRSSKKPLVRSLPHPTDRAASRSPASPRPTAAR